MQFNLTQDDIALLKSEDVDFDPQRDYSEDEAMNLLDLVRDIEVSYSQRPRDERLFYQYGDLADKIQRQISDN